MGKKIRHYDSTLKLQELLNTYFLARREDVLKDLLEKTGFNTMEELRNAEHNSYWGLDCGFVWMATANPEQHREWVLDNGKYDAKVRGIKYPYNCQSVTLKQIQLRKAIEDLELTGQYYPEVRLD